MSSHSHTPWRVYSTHAIFETDTPHIWPLLADFDGLPRLIPDLVLASTLQGLGVGSVRTLRFADGLSADETLISFHPEVFRQAYSMQDPSPFPWKHYFCTQQLQPLGAGQTHLLISGYCHPAEGKANAAKATMREVYHALYEGIARVLDVRVSIQPD